MNTAKSDEFTELAMAVQSSDSWYVASSDKHYNYASPYRQNWYLHNDLTLHNTTGFRSDVPFDQTPGYWDSEQEANDARKAFYKKHSMLPFDDDAFDAAMTGV